MKRMALGVVAMGLLALVTGCATNAKVGTGTWSGQYFGDVGVTGKNSNVTILRGSRVNKVSIIGDNNTITVEDGAFVNRVEFWGNGNTVSLPGGLIIRTTEVSRQGGNQIIRRPYVTTPPPEWPPMTETTGMPSESPPPTDALENDTRMPPGGALRPVTPPARESGETVPPPARESEPPML